MGDRLLAAGALSVLAACGTASTSTPEPTTITLAPATSASAPPREPTIATVAPPQSRQLFLSGAAHTCVLDHGVAWCWGFNGYGQLGVGSRADGVVPARLPIDDIETLDAGGVSTCVVRRGGALWCAGEHEMFGTDEHATDRGWLRPVPGFGPVRKVAVSVDAVCAEERDGRVRCAGKGETVPPPRDGSSARFLDGLVKPVSLRVEAWYGCALVSRGEVRCWGDPWMGLFGSGPPPGFAATSVPSPVGSLGDVVQIAMGDHHVCARRTNGTVACFGGNEHVKLGRPTPTAYDFDAAPVAGVTDAIDVAASAHHACVIRRGGDVWCWGADVAGSVESLHRVPMPDDEKAVSVRAGLLHTCVLLVSGDVACWGTNNFGQCAVPGGGDVAVPRRVVIPPG